jgi:HAD superfamily hydrolase (TIGR01549 family)
LCFADQVKIDGIYKKGVDRNKCWIQKDEATRRTLQTVGTEEGRDVFGKDVWINNLKEWMIMHAYRGIKRIIITDMRFINEFEFIKSLNGICIYVNSPKRNSDALDRESTMEDGIIDQEKRKILLSHPSETEMDNYKLDFDYIIENDYEQEKEAIIQCRNIVRSIIDTKRDNLVVFVDLDNTICECNLYYALQAQKVKDYIKSYLSEYIPAVVLNEIFIESVSKHNGNHFRTHFDLNSFSYSLDLVLQDFRKFMVEMSDDEFEKIRYNVRKIGKEVFDYSYEFLPGALDALKKLSKVAKVVIYTMGNRQEQVKKIASLGLSDYSFEIYDFKDETIYRNLMHRYPAKQYVMIGDSFSRDIEPAVSVGMIGYHITNSEMEYWYLAEKNTSQVEYFKVENLESAADRIYKQVYVN